MVEPHSQNLWWFFFCLVGLWYCKSMIILVIDRFQLDDGAVKGREQKSEVLTSQLNQIDSHFGGELRRLYSSVLLIFDSYSFLHINKINKSLFYAVLGGSSSHNLHNSWNLSCTQWKVIWGIYLCAIELCTKAAGKGEKGEGGGQFSSPLPFLANFKTSSSPATKSGWFFLFSLFKW